MTTAFSVDPKARPSPTSFTTNRSAPLRTAFARPWSSTLSAASPVSAAKPTTSWPGRSHHDDVGGGGGASNRVAQLERRPDRDDGDAGRNPDLEVRGHEGDPRSS